MSRFYQLVDRHFLFDIRESLLKKLIHLLDVREEIVTRARVLGVTLSEEVPIYRDVTPEPFDFPDLALYARLLKAHNHAILQDLKSKRGAPPSALIASIVSMAKSIPESFTIDSPSAKRQARKRSRRRKRLIRERSKRKQASSTPPASPVKPPSSEIRLFGFTARFFADTARRLLSSG